LKKYTDKEIEFARELRVSERHSFSHIHRLTGIPITTLRNWCKDLEQPSSSTSLLKFHEKIRSELKVSEISSLSKIDTIDASMAKILVSLLYWCEGAKYPSSNELNFVNSDVNLTLFFITLLRKAFILDESKFSLRLQIHSDQNYQELTKFWSSILNISESQFKKPTITTKRYGKHRSDYQGTCSLRYQDYRIQLKLIGLYEAVSQSVLRKK